MARPPIVISNGGMASALTQGLKPEDPNDSRSADQIILENVETMNARGPGSDPPVAKTLSGRNRDNNPRIYWRFEMEESYQKKNPGKGIEEIGIEAQ